MCTAYHRLIPYIYLWIDDRTGPSQRFARTSRWFQCHPAAWALSQGHKAISSGLGSAGVPWVVNSWIFEKSEKTCEKMKLIGVLLEFYGNFMKCSSFLYPFGIRKKRQQCLRWNTKPCGFMLADCHLWLSNLHFDTFRRTCEEEWSTLMFFCDYQGHWLHLYCSLLINHRRHIAWGITWCCCNSGRLNLWSHDMRFPNRSHQSLISSWPTTITSILQISIQLDSALRPWWQRRYWKPGAQGVDVLIADSLGVTRLGRASPSPNSPPGKVNKSSDSRNPLWDFILFQSLEEHQPPNLGNAVNDWLFR